MIVDAGRAPHPNEVEYGELPELTRALRALGSSRQSAGGGSQQWQFFYPLLDARRRAADARNAPARIRAFDAGELRRALDRTIERLIAEWPDKRDSVRRALRAELVERLSAYSRALTVLSERSADALACGESDRLTAWRAWTSQLAATFAAADRSWIAMRSVVEALQAKR